MTLETCAWDHDEDRVGRYVAGRLPPDERDAFEAHLLDCDECQAQVRLGLTIRAGARRPVAFFPAAGLAAVAAAALLVIVLTRPADSWNDLGRLARPPAFVPAPVRSGADSAGQLAGEGMAAYLRGAFGDAAERLGRAHALVPTDDGIAFFAGAARLLSNQPHAALRPLRAAASGSSPYADEAGILLAKAWLRTGRPDSALAALAAVRAAPRDSVGTWARALADSIRARTP